MKKTLKLLASAILSFIAGTATNEANAQTYCQPNTANFTNTSEWITNVTLGGINNSTGAGATSYSNFTSLSPAQLTIGTAATLSVTVSTNQTGGGDDVYAYIDWNRNGNFESGEFYGLAFGVSAGPHTVSITPPALALTGTTRMRVIIDSLGLNLGDPCLSLSGAFGVGGGEVEDYTVNVLPSNTTPVNSVTVTTQGGAAAAVTTNGGTLQMNATVLPAAAPQTVIWSIVPGTGMATISPAGLVTAQTNGTVWAKAVSNVNTSKKDSLLITISNQQPVAITSVSVHIQNSVPNIISTYGGSLQLEAAVLPSNAVQSVTWSIVPITGMATISGTGLVTAQVDGDVWAKAVSTVDPSKKDSLLVIMMNQVVPVDSIKVTTQGAVPATITTNAGTLQMVATIMPAAASQAVLWSIVPGTGTATISGAGLVTAQTNGTVWAKAVSTTNLNKKDSLLITISNQAITVSSVVVSTQGNVPATITTNGGTLQMKATVLPAAAPQAVTWSIVPVTGTATISATGLVTAQTNGTVWAKAVSTSNASKKDSLLVTITKQGTGINDLFTSGAVNVYPNPVSKQLNIDFAQWSSETFNVSIVNLSGQEVYKATLDRKKTVHDIANLAAGNYILTIQDAKGNRSGIKINKQ